jgi:RNA polymerase sigma-70 factor (ECF subfamily)
VASEASPLPDVLRRARAGDAAALEQLLQEYREFVRGLVRSRRPDRLQARVDHSDIIQETMLRVAQNIGDFQGNCEEEWKAWLARIAENEVVHQIRHHLAAARRAVGRESPRSAEPVGSAEGMSRLEEWLARTQTSPSLAAQRNERAFALADALTRLPEDYRRVLVLRHLDGMPFAAVAERMGRSEGAVRVLWTRALKKMREELIHIGNLGPGAG